MNEYFLALSSISPHICSNTFWLTSGCSRFCSSITRNQTWFSLLVSQSPFSFFSFPPTTFSICVTYSLTNPLVSPLLLLCPGKYILSPYPFPISISYISFIFSFSFYPSWTIWFEHWARPHWQGIHPRHILEQLLLHHHRLGNVHIFRTRNQFTISFFMGHPLPWW